MQDVESDVADDYDSPWKDAIEGHFSDFLHFFFPEVHAQIDWSESPDFLDKELSAVVREAELGRRFVDKLVRVRLRGGKTEWIYIHIEVQGTFQRQFAERMFVYHYRLYDRYRKPVASLALLADEQTDWRPQRYAHEICGCSLQLDFSVAKLMDWTGSEARLEDHRNPFALVTQAHLATRTTRDDPSARHATKWMLVQQLYRRGWDGEQVITLFKVLDWMMKLPEDLDKQFKVNLANFEEEANMPYVTSIERIATQEGLQKGRLQGMVEGMAKGMAKGMEEGMQQGVQQGRVEGKLQTLSRQLARRFGDLPAWAHERVDAASEAELDVWTDAVLSSDSLEAVLGMGPSRSSHP